MQPHGIINAGATISVAATANPPTGATLYVDFANMMERFLPTARGVWFVSQSLYSEMLRMTDPASNYVWQPSAREGVPSSLFGYPVIFTEKLPLLGSAGSVVLADWRYYLIGDRQATTIESTQYDMWRYDQTSWRVVHRCDGQPWLSTFLTLQDGTSTVSPFVILGAKTT